MSVDLGQLESIAKAVAVRHGCELVDLSFRREGGGWVLRVFIDRTAGVGVDVCAEISRDFSAELDVADMIDHAYTLEVSSPGLDRPLKSARDFQRYIGHSAKVKTRELVSERRNFVGKITGVADDESSFTIVVEDGSTHTIPLAVIAKANLKFEL